MSNKRSSLIIIFFIVIAIIIGIWMIEIIYDVIPYADQWTRFLVSIVKGTIVYDFFRFMTNFGSRSFVIPFTILTAIILFVLYRNVLPAFIFSCGTWGSHQLNQWIKHLVVRERPSILLEANAVGYSFPSGHAMISTVCYGLLAYFLMKKCSTKIEKQLICIGFMSLIFIIGISRFFINVHYLTDIIAGYFFGTILLFGFIYLYNLIERKRSRTRD